MTKLEPCPFCANTEVKRVGDWVICPRCGGQVSIKHWNDRAEVEVDEVIAVQLVMASGEHVLLPAAADQEKFDRTLKRMLGLDDGESDPNEAVQKPAKTATVEDMKAEDPAGEVGPRISLTNIPENIPETATAPDAGAESTSRASNGSSDPNTCDGPDCDGPDCDGPEKKDFTALLELLKAWMEVEKLSQVKAAKRIGISGPTLNQILLGKQQPSEATVAKIEAAIAADPPNTQEPPSAKETAASKEAPGASAAPRQAAKPKANGKPLRALVSDWMESEGFNYKQASSVAGVSVPTLTGICAGSKPRPETVEKLAKVVPGVEATAA